MPTQQISFGLSSGPGRFGPDGGARLFNAYAEKAPDGAKNQWLLFCRPGLTEFATLTGGAFRGAIDLGDTGYVVNATAVDKVDALGEVTNIGSFPGSGPAFMCRNRAAPNPQIVIVSSGQRALISGDTVSSITDTDLPAPIAVDSIGGYAVFAIEDGRYYWSAIDDASDIDALDFASAEANPDGLNCVKARGQEIVLTGPKSIEFHALTGSNLVFERVQQTTLDLGCLSGAAVKSLNGVLILPASDSTVRRLSGYSPERISTHAVERAIESLADKSTLTAWTFQHQGHQFYVLSAPTFTWVCDLMTGLWQEWQTYGSNRWRAEGYVEIDGQKIVGDYALGKLYRLDAGAGSDDDDYLVWKLVSGPVGEFPNRFIADQLSLGLLVGVGTPTATDPRVMLRTSNDDGRSWSSEMSAPLGGQGDYRRQVSFRRLGASGWDGMRFEIAVSAAVSRCLQGAALRYTPIAQ